MSQKKGAAGFQGLRSACRQSRGIFAAVILFGAFVNLLMLTGPLFMLQVYDRVLTSRSGPTLLLLFLLAVFLFAMMALLDHLRGRLMIRAAARLQRVLDRGVLAAELDTPAAASLRRDLDAVQSFIRAPVALALLDMPWTPLFAGLIFLFHPLMGWFALGGGALLVGLTVLNQWITRQGAATAALHMAAADDLAGAMTTGAETLRGLGMAPALLDRWVAMRGAAQRSAVTAADRTNLIAAVTRSFRLLLQSGMLALGALLVLQDALSPGAMLAASILLGRALQPVETALAQWPLAQAARAGWQRLDTVLPPAPMATMPTPLPRPTPDLEAQDLTLIAPGASQPALRLLGFHLGAGQIMGVLGPAGAGKTTLARAILGLWPAASGTLRLGGARIGQYDPRTLATHIGYLPQQVTLFDGTVADNIARFAPDADPAYVIVAAQRAGAHDMILSLPQGYDTVIGTGGPGLSGGQLKQIGLARAFHGEPVMLLLDEPEAGLDAAGVVALHQALRLFRSQGGTAIVITHRSTTIRECDMLLVLDRGTRRAFGPREEVMARRELAAAPPAQPLRAGSR
ncbi:type I secretion system permease/ATPase [Halodurantibacterium flavum]|uniref:Type I secretion system permease/ATPase n=1 Tax=Halodurantibacterium flavum TaxID=1382802 RepID=A0ABW4S6K7_9RHOB